MSRGEPIIGTILGAACFQVDVILILDVAAWQLCGGSKMEVPPPKPSGCDKNEIRTVAAEADHLAGALDRHVANVLSENAEHLPR